MEILDSINILIMVKKSPRDQQLAWNCERLLKLRQHKISYLFGTPKPRLQSGEMERNPDMDKTAVRAGRGCMAVSPISRLRFMDR